jgi:hypothetical protein
MGRACRLLNAKGRPRKPLAEVLLGSAPLRATSSVFVKAHGVPFSNLLKIQSCRELQVDCFCSNCSKAGKIYVGLGTVDGDAKAAVENFDVQASAACVPTQRSDATWTPGLQQCFWPKMFDSERSRHCATSVIIPEKLTRRTETCALSSAG